MTSLTDSPEFLRQRLQSWLNGASLTPADRQALQANLQTSAFNPQTLGSDPVNLEDQLQARLDLLRETHAEFQQFCQATWKGHLYPLELLWHLWLPLAMEVVTYYQQLDRSLILGFSGGQGTGKTTLTQVLQLILQQLGYRSVCLSIDDFYKTYIERQELQRQDPQLIWRGPPGTHDVDLGLRVLNQLRDPIAGQIIEIPRFDKSAHNGSGDRTNAEAVSNIDIVLFEGWFVGVRPVSPEVFEDAPDPIRTDRDRAFARETNERLKVYLPLWDRLDRLILLLPEDYRLSKTWRREAEQQMKATGKPGMSDAEIDQFVEYFWKALHPELFIEPLTRDPQRTDLVIEIDANHYPSRIYRPGNQ